MGDGGFEPPKASPADLQSVPFGHSGNPPYKIGAGGRIRTPDLLITNQLLYQLSYTSMSSLAILTRSAPFVNRKFCGMREFQSYVMENRPVGVQRATSLARRLALLGAEYRTARHTPAQPLCAARLSSHCANVPPARLLLLLPARSACAKAELVSSLLFYPLQKQRTPHRVSFAFGAGDEARTRYLDLGKVALYQMSYARKRKADYSARSAVCQPRIFKFICRPE